MMKRLLTLLVLAAISAGVFALGSLRGKSDSKAILHVAEEVALTVTHQLGRRMAIATCSVMCLAAIGGRAALEFV